MKRKSFSVVTLLLVMSWFSGAAIAAQYEILPVADCAVDALVEGDTGGTINLLTYRINLFGNPQDIAISFLRFDLTSLPGNIVSAALWAYQWSGAQVALGGTGTDLYFVEDDTWDEHAINWTNHPAYSSFLGNNPNLVDWVGWSTWDLNLNAVGLMTDRVWSMALLEQALNYIGGSEHDFYSREYGTNEEDPEGASAFRPYLSVQTDAVPAPGTLFLLGSGLAGLAWVRRSFSLRSGGNVRGLS